LFEDCYALKWEADFDLGFFKKLTFVPNRDKVKAFEFLENNNIDFFGLVFDVLTYVSSDCMFAKYNNRLVK
jgi:hypothetical protein